jgi:hypothetical protein
MSEYEQGYYDSQNRYGGNANRSYQDGRAMGSLLGLILRGIIGLVPVVFKLIPFSPFLVVGLAVADWLPLPGSGPHLVVGLGLAYVFLQALYFLKGLGIARRLRGGRAGLLVLGLFVAGSSLLPALVLYHVVRWPSSCPMFN